MSFLEFLTQVYAQLRVEKGDAYTNIFISLGLLNLIFVVVRLWRLLYFSLRGEHVRGKIISYPFIPTLPTYRTSKLTQSKKPIVEFTRTNNKTFKKQINFFWINMNEDYSYAPMNRTSWFKLDFQAKIVPKNSHIDLLVTDNKIIAFGYFYLASLLMSIGTLITIAKFLHIRDYADIYHFAPTYFLMFDQLFPNIALLIILSVLYLLCKDWFKVKSYFQQHKKISAHHP